MKVYKFGGASVKDAQGIINLSGVVSFEPGDLIIVVSAFGKTTNALEKLLSEWLAGENRYRETLAEIIDYHENVIKELFAGCNPVRTDIDASYGTLRRHLAAGPTQDYDYEYDQVVSFGEMWSTIIVAGHLRTVYAGTRWTDIRSVLKTDNRFRDANVLWEESLVEALKIFNFEKHRLYVTQGFIASTIDGRSTTLGREGSDYTAAILGNMLDAESVTVWKDVPGILNSDPKWMEDAVKLSRISYREAVEMSFSGAKVIHPKTIKPLQNKNIPLYVKSFLAPAQAGTVITLDPEITGTVPVFVRKEGQILVSLVPVDFSFVMGDNLSRIFRYFSDRGIKVNLVEASAVSIDVCVNNEKPGVEAFMNDLKSEFTIVYNENVEMLTIRHYDDQAIQRVTSGREILLEQRTRSTVRFVVR
jgi:aspartate kinase